MVLSNLLSFTFLFIWKAEGEIFHPPVGFPNAHDSQSWARLKNPTQSVFPLWVAGTQLAWNITCWLLRCAPVGNWNWKPAATQSRPSDTATNRTGVLTTAPNSCPHPLCLETVIQVGFLFVCLLAFLHMMYVRPCLTRWHLRGRKFPFEISTPL